MKKLIDPGKPAIIEHYCDTCKELIVIEGLPEDQIPIIKKQFAVALHGNFGYNSCNTGLFFDLDLCDECGMKLVTVMETMFNIKIESPLMEGE